MICIICAISYYFIFRDKDLYEGYKYNITPQVEFLNNVLKKEYGNKYKIYTALFNDDDEIPDIGEYDENAILWLGKKEFKITPDLPKNIAKFGKILVADFQKLRVIEYIFKKKAYQFPEFVVNNIIKERKPNYYALVGNPLYVKDYLDDNNLKYKKYSYAKLDDLRKDLSEIKAIFIEQDYNPNFNMDTVFLEAIANGIIVAENKVKDLTSPQALVGEIVEYYFTLY